MLPDILFGGVKKFGQLALVHTDHAIFGIERYRSFAVHGVVNNDVLPVFSQDQFSGMAFSKVDFNMIIR